MIMTKAKSSICMTEGRILPNMIRFLLPIMLTAMIQKFYHAADSAVVGRFAGEAALAGVGATGAITNLIHNLFFGGAGGVALVLGWSLGANDKEEIKKVVHTAFAMALTFGAVISLIGVVFAEYFLAFTNVNAEIMPHAKIYMQIIFVGKIPSIIYNFGAAMLRAKGDSERPLRIITVSGIMNIVLNIIF